MIDLISRRPNSLPMKKYCDPLNSSSQNLVESSSVCYYTID